MPKGKRVLSLTLPLHTPAQRFSTGNAEALWLGKSMLQECPRLYRIFSLPAPTHQLTVAAPSWRQPKPQIHVFQTPLENDIAPT